MLTGEEFVEATALYRRGWSISAIARHLGQAEAAAALFEVVQRRYLKGSIILTTKPRHRQLGPDLRRPDDRRRHARPAASPQHRPPDRRRELPDARTPRPSRAAASRLESMRAAQSANWLSSSRRLRSWAKRSRPSM